MTSTTDKYRQLVRRLYQRTLEKKLLWEIDPIDNAIGVRIGDNLVELTEESASDGRPLIYVNVRKRDGNLLEKFCDEDIDDGSRVSGEFESYYKMMLASIYIAKRQALGVEDVIDNIIDQLEEE